MKTITHILVGLILASIASCQEVRTVKVTASEENGTPIEGVEATITFMGYSGRQTQKIKGNTDSKGIFQASGSPELRMYVRLQKNGYYTTESDRLSRTQDHELTYVLRKVASPVPLYAKNFSGKLPNLGDKHGFDFEVGDWVAPHGKGKISDIFMTVNIVGAKSKQPSGSIKITFPQESEGAFIVNEQTGYMPTSALIMPHMAPSQDFVQIITRQESGYENKSKPHNESYFFRTRSKVIQQGKLVFHYSKFLDGFSFVMGGGVFLEEVYRKKHPEEYGLVKFTYYFNPNPNDKNLEFDTKRNLFNNLASAEQVREP